MWRGLESYPLSPTAHDDNRRTPSEEDTSDEDDHEFMQRDLILGLLNTELLVRLRFAVFKKYPNQETEILTHLLFRFILELLNPEPIVVIVILRILLRIARHSAESAGHFVRVRLVNIINFVYSQSNKHRFSVQVCWKCCMG